MRVEHRYSPRVKPKETLLVDYPAYRPAVRDISLAGAFIEDQRPIPPGHVIRLRIQLSANESITANVMVRRVEEARFMSVFFLPIFVAFLNLLLFIVFCFSVFLLFYCHPLFFFCLIALSLLM